MNSKIPKRIIQTAKSSHLPILEKAAVANVRLLNPDFEYLFFDDKQVVEFIDLHFPEYRSVFDAFRFPISKYDFFRYLAVYHFGGFYLDLDVFLASGLEGLLEYSCVFTFEELNVSDYLRRTYGMDWSVGNYAFGAAAGHPFMNAIIKNCIKAQRDPQWVREMMNSIPRVFHERDYALYASAPGLVTRTLAEYADANNQVKVLFPEDVRDSAHWYRFGEYGAHLMKGNWRKQGGFWGKAFYNIWMSRIENRLFKESRMLGPHRSLDFTKKVQNLDDL
jgi:inositol phosphorylceramide mannosyltransferase catalytic subunit